ncbi:MAG: L-lactate dehydrogenase [Clostridiales bacterium]|nr:L-lactate dehydrogenase [Clostridiales bacterium]
MKRVKVAIVGMGNVGSTLAYQLISMNVCDDLVLIDLNYDKAWAEAMDLNHAMGFSDTKMHVFAGGYEDCKDADIVVLAVGAPYKIGMTRLDMLEKAAAIVKAIVPQVVGSGFSGIFVVITNPVDAMTYLVQRLSGFSAARVIGTGTSLDSSRLNKYISDIMGVDARSINAFCMGEHGDSQMIPWSQITVGGKKFLEILKDNQARLGEVDLDRVRTDIAQIAYKIVQNKGATFFGIASVTTQIIKAIIRDENKVLPVSVMLSGEYGESDVYAGVPAVLTNQGIKELVEYHLTPQELMEFKQSLLILKEANQKI